MTDSTKWKKENPEKVKQANKNWYIKNKNNKSFKLKRKKYKEKNKEAIKLKAKKHFQKNKHIVLKQTQQKRKENRHKYWAIATIQSHKRRFILRSTINVIWLTKIAKETKKCYLCNIKLDWNEKVNKGPLPISPSLDRIDNGKILNRKNIQIICQKCNITKGSRTMKEFINYCKKISKL